MTSVLCKICGLNKVEKIIHCKQCGILCCKNCYEHHKPYCETLKQNLYHLCSLHKKSQVHGYCCECFQLICEKCVSNHHEHNIAGIAEASANIKMDLYGEINQMESMTRLYCEAYTKVKESLLSVVAEIKVERTKWITLIDEIVKSFRSKVYSDIHWIESRLQTNEMFLVNLNHNKNGLTDLTSVSFQLVFLSKYSTIIRQLIKTEKQDMKDRTLPTPVDVRNQFRLLIMNRDGAPGNKSKSDEETAVGELTETLSNISLCETRGKQDFTSEFSRYVADINEPVATRQTIHTVECSVAEYKTNEQIPIMAESMNKEIACIKHQNLQLQEQITDMAKHLAWYHDQQTFMKNTIESVIRCIKKTDDMTGHIEVSSKPPQGQNTEQNEFLEHTEYIVNHIIKITNNLRRAEELVKDECLPVAEWTDSQDQICLDKLESDRELKEKLEQLCEKDAINYASNMEEFQAAYDYLQSQHKALQQQAIDLQKKIQEHSLMCNSLQQENINLQKRLADKEKECICLLHTMQDMKLSEFEKRHKDNLQKSKDNEIQNLQLTIQRLRVELSQTANSLQTQQRDKEDLQNRLSKVCGDKLTKGNPAVTDLGDPNCPMKVGEGYAELYDNEWTDVMESTNDVKGLFPDLKKPDIEEIIICHLYKILTVCYEECVKISKQQLMPIQLSMSGYTDTETTTDMSVLPCFIEFTAARRQSSGHFANYLLKNKVIHEKIDVSNWDYPRKNASLIKVLIEKPFFDKCVRLCWHMATQEPMMYLRENLSKGTTYDKNIFKEFVQSGDKVEYVVWPALFLHKNGPLLYKGVVQAYK